MKRFLKSWDACRHPDGRAGSVLAPGAAAQTGSISGTILM